MQSSNCSCLQYIIPRYITLKVLTSRWNVYFQSFSLFQTVTCNFKIFMYDFSKGMTANYLSKLTMLPASGLYFPWKYNLSFLVFIIVKFVKPTFFLLFCFRKKSKHVFYYDFFPQTRMFNRKQFQSFDQHSTDFLIICTFNMS